MQRFEYIKKKFQDSSFRVILVERVVLVQTPLTKSKSLLSVIFDDNFVLFSVSSANSSVQLLLLPNHI